MSRHILIILTTICFQVLADELVLEKIHNVSDRILELETAIELENNLDLRKEILQLDREIWTYRNSLNTLNDNTRSWNDSELLLLEAKKNLDKLNNKIKLEGNWGKIGLNLDREEQYRKLDLKYRYGF